MILPVTWPPIPRLCNSASRVNEYSSSAFRNCSSLAVKLLMMRSISAWGSVGEAMLLP